MRRFIRALIALSAVSLIAHAEPPAEPTQGSGGSEQKLPPLKVTVDRSKVDLKGRRLEVKLSRTAKSVHIKVQGESGSILADEDHDFSGKSAGTALVVRWSPSSDEAVARIEVFGYDTDGYYAGVAIVPWSVSIPHQEVLFDTDKAEIKASEKPKLEESFKRIEEAISAHKELGAIKLFIAGHTDTVGTPAHNLELSRKRARAIAQWFKKRGLKSPVMWEGFGDTMLLKKTEDEVDEPKNRRVDYILAIEPPSSKTNASWKKT